MGKELLLEIGTEEIPARFLPNALKKLADGAKQLLEENRVRVDEIFTYGTPRRLILFIKSVHEQQENFVEEITGPPKRVAYDTENKPTKAALGFAKKSGVSLEDLQIRNIEGKGEYLFTVKQHLGQPTDQILGKVLHRLVSGLSFPKVMRWGEGSFSFARPIHWILALFGSEIIPFSIDGIKSSNLTYGHRFLNPGPFEVTGFSSFQKTLEEAAVIIDPQERKSLIQQQISALADTVGGSVPEDPGLLETVTYLVEYPVAICGSFESRFLQLPKEVLITSMRSHQKYFPIYDSDQKLMNRFISICNIKTADDGIIRAGNERVLRARLTDAEFFYHEDRKKPLAEYVEGLKEVVFQKKLGSLYEKVERIQKIVSILGEMILPSLEGNNQEEVAKNAHRAAFLCKADLITEMVKEFPELQGVMGKEYALLSGEYPEIAKAIYEHYLPRFQDDVLPQTPAGALVAIADKMDNIIGCFGLGLIPTGSEDPYALRRQALGIIHIISQQGYRLSLNKLIQDSLNLFKEKINRVQKEVNQEVISFFQQRIFSLFSGYGFRHDVIESVLATDENDIVEIRKKIEAVADFQKEAGFDSLLASFKRVINIIPKDFVGEKIDPSLLKEEAEKSLLAKLVELTERISQSFRQEDFTQILKDLAGLKEYVDSFFEEILVMAGDERLKKNRLSLLCAIRDIFFQITDFSKIVAERG